MSILQKVGNSLTSGVAMTFQEAPCSISLHKLLYLKHPHYWFLVVRY